jgi:hypothetical protein
VQGDALIREAAGVPHLSVMEFPDGGDVPHCDQPMPPMAASVPMYGVALSQSWWREHNAWWPDSPEPGQIGVWQQALPACARRAKVPGLVL